VIGAILTYFHDKTTASTQQQQQHCDVPSYLDAGVPTAHQQTPAVDTGHPSQLRTSRGYIDLLDHGARLQGQAGNTVGGPMTWYMPPPGEMTGVRVYPPTTSCIQEPSLSSIHTTRCLSSNSQTFPLTDPSHNNPPAATHYTIW
jgi:hypothetical protein